MTFDASRPLRAITVWQPWAGLLACGSKTVENRTWAPRAGELRVGERVAIHAGVKYDPESWQCVFDMRRQLTPANRWRGAESAPWPLRGAKPSPDADPADCTPYGAIIGVAVLDEVRTSPRVFRDDAGEYTDPFWCGPVGWYLRDAVAFPAVYCKGAQGLWIVRGETLDAVLARCAATKKV